MASDRGSISVRLAVGLALALGVLGAPLLITLDRLAAVRRATEQAASYVQLRHQVVLMSKTGEDMLAIHSGLWTPEGVDRSKWDEFRLHTQSLEHLLDSMWARGIEKHEITYLNELSSSAEALHDLISEPTLRARIEAPEGEVPPELLARTRTRSRELLERIVELCEYLASSFDIRTVHAAAQAGEAWTVSVATSRIVFPFALLVSFLVIYYVHRSITRPVSALVQGTKALTRGDLTEHIDVTGYGEFSELADSFNQMARALVTNQKQLVEAEKLAVVGRLAAGMAHEINNPITVIMGYTKMLENGLQGDGPAREQLRSIAQEAQQCKSIISGLLDLSRPLERTPGEVINPNKVVAEVLNMAQAMQLTERVRIEKAVIDRPLPLTIGRSRLRQIILNIIRNALEVLQDGRDACLRLEGYVRPRDKLEPAGLAERVSASKSFLVLVFTDNGPGMPPEHLKHLFEPFFTTKPDGIGLGLAICHNIAAAHGGFIDAQSVRGSGTTFTVGLPLAE